MGRLERDLKKKVKNTKKDYSEWYSEHEQQILWRIEETNSDVDLGNIKAKRRVPVKVWIVVGAVILIAAIITMSVLLNKTEDKVPEMPDFSFGAEDVSDEIMSYEEIDEIVISYPQLSKMSVVRGNKSIYLNDGSVVMDTINGEIETKDDFYMIEVRIAYTDNFVFFDKWEYEDLENQIVINETEIEYAAKGTDDYGMYLYYAVTQAEDATLYWKVICIEGLFNEWLQIMFA